MSKPTYCICGSSHIVKNGKQITRQGKKQRFLCCDCGRITLGDAV